jgi:BMFP domain-containing protein YqiC
MNIIKQLNGINVRLNELLEDIEHIMEYTDNNELYNEIDNNIKSQLENAQTHLDIAIDDINDGMYEEAPRDEEDSDWD